MAEVRKTPGSGAARGVIYDFAAARERARAAAPVAAPDSAGITEGARELARARTAVEDAPDVRAEKLKALKSQIANGQYQPDPLDVARRMLEAGF
jgi:negative regulator of flagellin synthesis FlgM